MVYEGAFKTKLPHTGSHEPTGTIAALGPDVSGGWEFGDRVGVHLFTNACANCRGIKGADAGFAEYMITADDAIVKIPEEVPFERKHLHNSLIPLLALSQEHRLPVLALCSDTQYFRQGQRTPAHSRTRLRISTTDS